MFKVGMTRRSYCDPARSSWAGSTPRPLEAVLWYPADARAVEDEAYLGPPETAWFRMGPAARNAPPAELPSPLPLVLLSHGTGGSALQMGWLARRLAARGFLAASLDHHGNNAVEPYIPQGFLASWERARDLSVLVDRLVVDSEFGPRVDPTRIGAAGFSLGGYTVTALAGAVTDLERFASWASGPEADGPSRGPREFPDLADHLPRLLTSDPTFRAAYDRHGQSYRDPRLRAAFAIAPVLAQAFTDGSLRNIACPLSIVVGAADRETPPGPNARRIADLVPGAALTVLPGPVGHYVFLCEATELGREEDPSICCDAPGVARRDVHDQVAAMAANFFASHLDWPIQGPVEGSGHVP